jgi:DNA-binding CsgD family transcriptional regulator/tetratricopeptide (TPR) repeat protein
MAVTSVEVPLPPVLGIEAEFPFVGRSEAWAALVQAWTMAARGGRRAVLVGGEAGSGKTRLVTEVSRWVHAEGGAVVYGACSEQPSVPYEPFTMALDQLTASLDDDARVSLLRDRRDELARLVPRLAERPDHAERPEPAGPRIDPDAGRFRLYGAVASMLGALAERRRLLLILDDLHWARRPTVELLGHIMRAPGLTRLCVLLTYRSTPAEVGEDFKAALPDLRRYPGVSRVGLGGFDREGVRQFVAAAAGHEPNDDLERVADVLARETDGNAFLLGELWRHLAQTGDLVQVGGRWRLARPLSEVTSPESVRDMVAARLDRLPDGTRSLLHVAAVVGTTFPISLVSAAAGRDSREVVGLLDPAVRAHVVEEAGTGEHRFIHALVRRAVVDGLPAGERQVHHLDIAEALDRTAGDRAAAEIAHHTLAAVPVVEAGRAVEAGRRAAEAAYRAVAYDDAARLLEQVLPLVPPDHERCDLLLQLAVARMRAGDVATAQDRCLEATALAHELDDPDMVVAAALTFDDANWRAALHGGVAERLLRDALPLATDPALSLRVRAALSRALALSGKGDEAESLAEATIEAAHDAGDPEALRIAYAAALFNPWTPDRHDRLRLIARELVEHAQAEGDLEWELGGLDKLLFASITAGELDEARAIAARHRTLSLRLGQPLFRVLDLQAHALLAMGEGRFGEAESLAEEADGLAGFLSGNDVAGGYGVQVFSIRREQGRLDEARPLVEAVARLGQAGATWRPALAVLYAELGLRDEAARELDFVVADDLAALPRDSLWWGSLSYLADACVLLRDADAGSVVYSALVPARGLVVQVGNLLAAYGSADRYLGGLCALLGRRRDAEAHFEAALRIDRRSGMPVWLARTQLAYGRFLAERARPGDPERAAAMLRAAESAAAGCGMRGVASMASATLAAMPAVSAVSGGSDPTGATGAGTDPVVAVQPVAGLTARELAILPLLAEGRTNREIGDRLHISQHTAANHIRSILLKTGCANRTEAAAWALRRGLAGD